MRIFAVPRLLIQKFFSKIWKLNKILIVRYYPCL